MKAVARNRLIFWLPRVMCMAAIIFISLFALDAFQPELTIWQQIGGFLIHMLPSFALIALLIFAWRREFIGGILILIAGVLLGAWIINLHQGSDFSTITTVSSVLMLALPFIIAGFLFIAHYRIKRKDQKE